MSPTSPKCWKLLKTNDFLGFEDFVKSCGTIITGTPLQLGQGSFPPRKRTFRRYLRKFEQYFSCLSTFCDRIRTVECVPVVNVPSDFKNSSKSIKIIDFQQFSTFWWCWWHLGISTVLIRSQKVNKHEKYRSNVLNHLRNVCFRGEKLPWPNWSGVPVVIVPSDFMKSSKSIKILDFHWFPLSTTRAYSTSASRARPEKIQCFVKISILKKKLCQ